ncbi:peptidylprolyl isomerase [Flavihumibacter profundi]|uniref:peptidylprolyl isomerase n=1 Tax=Flavihumibacter profundi TaxID=2716883 RepID=UPI001CC63C72|nr:SurA N-terminal domain-containing protein [Flavihumibacter profundi]MBZ5859062.1 SurA N-terminal domain-containing protein [Flavihumibacter profundi]
MSIIQTIRDKAAWLVFGVIALSLLGFLLMDAFVGKSGRGIMAGNKSTIGSVNGNKIDYIEYQKKVQMVETQYQQSGYPMNEMMRQNVQDQVWNQFIEENVLKPEYEELGLSVTPKELDDILFGANPPQDLRQQFTNEQGVYDANAAKAALANLRSKKDNPMAQNLNDVYLPSLMEARLREKYSSLLGNTYYIPKWMAEKTTADNSQLAAVNYVAVPYSTVSDSAAEVKVTDSDIESFIAKHKEEYKQEASRSISYVAFSAAPSSADSIAIITTLNNLKPEFAAAADPAAFLVRNNTETPYFDGYVLKSKLQVPNADTIRNLPEGALFGPYLDAANVTIAKMISKRTLPDSVKCRHILINTQNIPDSIARKRIDSIELAIRGGADFAALAAKYSDDQGSKNKGGEYSFASQTIPTLAKEFGDAILYGNKGDKKVVKTSFGYHYIEVLDQKNFETAYKVAYLSRAITASVETENAASGAANQFAGESRTAKAFEDMVVKDKLTKLQASEIKPNDAMIQGLGSSRQLVRWINEAKIGDVSEPFNIEDKYVVALLSEINTEGTMSVAKARPQVEFIIRNQKKAEQIRKKIGTANTLDAIAAATQQTIKHSDSIRFSAPIIPNVGQEPKVIGAAFNKANQAKISAPIPGNAGVYVLKTENVSAVSDGGVNPDDQRKAKMQQMRQMSGFRAIDGLRKAATIKDERAKIL